MTPRVIIGLGNPGRAYARHRHNVGFQCLDILARRHRLAFTRRRAHSLIAEGTIGDTAVVLAKPQTWMNLSGEAIPGILRSWPVTPADLLVVYDDLDLPLGVIRLRPSGSSGGHKGMRSIIARLGTEDFPRLRIGIGRPADGDEVSYVLEPFTAEERKILVPTLERAADAIECVLRDGLAAAMNRFNAPPPSGESPP